MVERMAFKIRQPTDYFIKKQFELFDMIQVRHGMMLVGPTGGGKTCCYRALQAGQHRRIATLQAFQGESHPKPCENQRRMTHSPLVLGQK